MGCGIDEIRMYRGVVAQVRKTHTGVGHNAQVLETEHVVRQVAALIRPGPKGRGVMVTTAGWSWVQVPGR